MSQFESAEETGESKKAGNVLPDLRQNPFVSPGKEYLDIDTAIVGAGPAGLYSAFRLAEACPLQTTCLFDATSRGGGRVLTIAPSMFPHYSDAGAMRFLPHQALIGALQRHFLLPEPYDYEFPTWSYFVRGRDIRSKKFCDAHAGLAERILRAPETPSPYIDQSAYRDLDKDEELGLEPAQLIALGIAKTLGKCLISGEYRKAKELASKAGNLDDVQNAIDNASSKGANLAYSDIDPYKWKAFKLYGVHNEDMKPLYQLGFWDVIQKELTSEAFKFAEDGLGYQTIIGTWNAAEAIPWFLADFSGGKYKSLKGGMSTLFDKLLDEFLRKAISSQAAQVKPEHIFYRKWQLKSVERYQTQDDHSFQLVFSQKSDDAPMATQERPLKKNDPTLEVRARRVILAVSKGALEKIDFKGFVYERNDTPEESQEHFREALQCVSSHPLLKTFMWFSTPWWFDASMEKDTLAKVGLTKNTNGAQTDTGAPNGNGKTDFCTGKVFTDLPLRMIYYHGPQSGGRRESAAESRISMIMAYCDARHAEYWESLNDLEEKAWINTDLSRQLQKGSLDLNIVNLFGVTETFAERMHEQLYRIHGHTTKLGKNDESMKSLFAVFMNWSRPPYYGGWHSWKINYNATEVQSKIMVPFIGSRLFICGESFSFDQGWIEGALKTAESMLIKQFGLPPAKWNGYEKHVEKFGYLTTEDYCEM